MSGPFNLHRFVDAQRETYEAALAELREGAKRGHWMWFIFPQLAGLGNSPNSVFYAIASLDEAQAFLAHPLLGSRLKESVETLLPWAERRTPERILGPIDALKLRSSLTLFDRVAPGALFGRALDLFFDGARDERTLALLRGTH